MEGVTLAGLGFLWFARSFFGGFLRDSENDKKKMQDLDIMSLKPIRKSQ
jgi:hypothetical protein